MQSLLNTITIRFFSSPSRGLLAMFALLWLAHASPAMGQDLNSMPWMDQESGEISPVGVKEREPSLTGDRDSIPIKPLKKKVTTGTTTGRAWNMGNGFNLPAFGPVAVYGLFFLAAAVVIGLVVWVLLNSQIDIDAGSVSSRSDRSLAESIRHLPFEMDVKQGDFRQQAQTAYEAGDFRKALVFLFSHVLVTLDQAKLVRLKKGKTNRQYLRELSSSRPLANYYGDVMVPFEQTFFGDYPITKDVFEGCWQGLDDFQNEVDAARSKLARSNSVLSNAVHSNAAVGSSTAEGQGLNV